MIEFTMSRAVLCICGAMMLAAAVAAASAGEEGWRSGMGDALARDVAGMLDAFEASGVDEITLSGWDILPSQSCSLSVGDHAVRVHSPDGDFMAYTQFPGRFELSYGEEKILSSVPEHFGYVPHGRHERVDLLGGVVDVGGRPGAPVDSARHVERVGAVHTGPDHDPGHAVGHHRYVVGAEPVYVERQYAVPPGRVRGAHEVEVPHVLEALHGAGQELPVPPLHLVHAYAG